MKVDGPVLHTITGAISGVSSRCSVSVRLDRIERVDPVRLYYGPIRHKTPGVSFEVHLVSGVSCICGFARSTGGSTILEFDDDEQRLAKCRDELIAAWKTALQPAQGTST